MPFGAHLRRPSGLADTESASECLEMPCGLISQGRNPFPIRFAPHARNTQDSSAPARNGGGSISESAAPTSVPSSCCPRTLAPPSKWCSRRPGQWSHLILTLVPAIVNPFRRSHISPSGRHDGYLGGCRNQRSSFRELMEPPRLSPMNEPARRLRFSIRLLFTQHPIRRFSQMPGYRPDRLGVTPTPRHAVIQPTDVARCRTPARQTDRVRRFDEGALEVAVDVGTRGTESGLPAARRGHPGSLARPGRKRRRHPMTSGLPVVSGREAIRVAEPPGFSVAQPGAARTRPGRGLREMDGLLLHRL